MGKTTRIVVGIICLFSSLFALTAGILQGQIKPVTVVVGDQEIRWETAMNTVSACLYELGILVDAKDVVVPSLDAPITRGMEITVRRAFDISVTDEGKQKTYTVSAKAVGEALSELGIVIYEDDIVIPALDRPIGPNSEITITRVENKLVKEIEKIPYILWEFPDNRIDEGKTMVWRQGSNGAKEKIFKVREENGQIVSKVLVEEKIIEQPKVHVIARGTKPLFYTLKTPTGSILYTKKLRLEATAYYPGPESTGKFADGYTAIGLVAGHGIIAVDPKVIPLRTRVYIPNYGFAIAGDVGAAIKGNLIDLCFDTYREAIQFGRRKVDVYILADQGR